MVCKKCGAELAPGTVFCPICSTPAPDARSPKKKWVALILCLLFGTWGWHRFYVGKIFTGILWMLTCGFFLVGFFVDLILILAGQFKDKRKLRLR